MTSSDDLNPLSRESSSPRADAAAGGTILLPPPPLPSQPTDTEGRIRVQARLLDRLLMVGVLALAFVLASLPARNSDVWLHLASGRLLAHGQYHFGVDPFAFTTEGVRWVNPSWLYDLLSFLLFQAAGGAALVVAKAIGMTLLAYILIRLPRTTPDRQTDGAGWTAAVFAAVAVIVVGSSMPLRPIWFSYLFLAVTLWVLETRLMANPPPSLASWWPVPLVFALWANVDAWFVLGPLSVGLYLLGSLLIGGTRAGQTRDLAVVFVAGLAACLLNPHHYRIFALPPLLPFTPEAAMLHDDPIFSRFWQSPFQADALRFREIPHLGRWLYYLLVVLGPVSFVLNGLAARSRADNTAAVCLRRLPVWLAFFALSAFDISTLPFMAIVASPLTALNFQEYQRRRQALRSSPLAAHRLRMLGGRMLTLLGIVVLVIAAWPGWLQGQLREPRGWMVETDVSLVEGVQQTARWRQLGRIQPRETGFNFSPTAAHYAAWFAPEEKSFWDSRWRLFASADYVTVRRALLGDSSVLDAARRILREHGVTHLLLHDSDPAWTAGVFQRLMIARAEWPILFLKGDTVVLGWRDPAHSDEPDRFADWQLDFHRRAFQPLDEEQAPAQGPSRAPNASGWRSYWTIAPETASHDSEEAALYLIYFDTLRPSILAGQWVAWHYSRAAGLAVARPSFADVPRWFLDFAALQASQTAALPPTGAERRSLEILARQLMEQEGLQHDDGPPGLVLLALRAARRAINENPDDARAYQLLGEAYLHLMHNTRERLSKIDLPALAFIRQIQATCALHRALRLQPERIQPHIDLCVVYQDMELFDLALHHARQGLRLSQSLGKFSGERSESWERRLRGLEQLVHRLEDEVQRRLNNYEVQAVRRSVVEQAVLAKEQGLGGKSLEILLASDVAVFGRRGAELELELLLSAGRINEAREWMAPGQNIDVSKDSYRRFQILLSAAAGDYDACEKELAELAAALERPMRVELNAWKLTPLLRGQHGAAAETLAPSLQLPARQFFGLGTALLLLDLPWQRQSIPWLLTTQLERAAFLEGSQSIPARIRQQGELDVIRSALALERGRIAQAQILLPRALAIWVSRSAAASGAGLDFDGRRTAQALLAWLSPQR